jgi:hypothetical protein
VIDSIPFRRLFTQRERVDAGMFVKFKGAELSGTQRIENKSDA